MEHVETGSNGHLINRVSGGGTPRKHDRGDDSMYRVEWIDDNGDIRIARGFKTSEEAHDWIRAHNFNIDFDCPMVFYEGE